MEKSETHTLSEHSISVSVQFLCGRYPYRRRAHRPSASCRIPCASHTRSVTFAATSLEICSSREIGFFRLTGWPQGTKLASTLVAGAARRAGRTARGRRGKGTFYPQLRHFYGERLQFRVSAKGRSSSPKES